MDNSKVIILAEVSIVPEYLEEVKASAAATLTLTLQEPGCEAFYQSSKKDDPNALVFFEVFTSKAAFDFHMEMEYTKAFFASIQSKTTGKPMTTILSQL